MLKGILSLITPIRHCDTVLVRVVRAPALQSLAKNTDKELKNNGVVLELGDHLNKNSNCVVNKKIQELARALCKSDPL